MGQSSHSGFGGVIVWISFDNAHNARAGSYFSGAWCMVAVKLARGEVFFSESVGHRCIILHEFSFRLSS